MIKETYKTFIEKRLGETIEESRLLTETRPSRIYHVSGKRQYILKETKRIALNQQFATHKKIFKAWFDQRDTLAFKIPEPFLLGPDGRFILMEYVDGDNLLKRLVSGQDNIEELFRHAGRGLRQYHALVTQAFNDLKRDLSQYEYMAEVIAKPGGHVICSRLDDFPFECKRILFKDFSPSNVVISRSGKVYFIDVQEAFYFGPFYYDLSRFIDTTKVFSIIRNPLCMLSGHHRVRRVVRAFLAGYGNDVDFDLLKKMQYIHRKEHIHIKMTVTPLSAIILKVLYAVI